MGCTSSREARLRHHQRHHRGLAPYIRSQSMPIHEVGSSRRIVYSKHHNPLDDPIFDNEFMMKCSNDANVNKPKNSSEIIDREAPKTPTKTPNREPETINTWELMEGLEEAIILDKSRNINARSKSFSSVASSPKPIWMQISPDDSIISEFDPDIISNFRKALDDSMDESPKFEDTHKRSSSMGETIKFNGIVKARIKDFQKRIDEKRNKKWRCPPNGERKVVIYTTSLRGIRKTYEDCFGVKVILQGYGVKVDERDVSMHMGYKEEVNEILGHGNRLPRVFANEKYVGGAEEVRHMHEVGELEEVLMECEKVKIGKGGGVCEMCGDVRFVPCENCSGSCKIFVEDGEEEEVRGGGGFKRCPDCNENGLVRCSLCL